MTSIPPHRCRDHLDYLGGLTYECVACGHCYAPVDLRPGGLLNDDRDPSGDQGSGPR